MQRIGESRWRPLELCYWPDQGALPAKGKEYPGLGYKRLRDKPPKSQEQQQQPAEAHQGQHLVQRSKVTYARLPKPPHSQDSVELALGRAEAAATQVYEELIGMLQLEQAAGKPLNAPAGVNAAELLGQMTHKATRALVQLGRGSLRGRTPAAPAASVTTQEVTSTSTSGSHDTSTGPRETAPGADAAASAMCGLTTEVKEAMHTLTQLLDEHVKRKSTRTRLLHMFFNGKPVMRRRAALKLANPTITKWLMHKTTQAKQLVRAYVQAVELDIAANQDNSMEDMPDAAQQPPPAPASAAPAATSAAPQAPSAQPASAAQQPAAAAAATRLTQLRPVAVVVPPNTTTHDRINHLERENRSLKQKQVNNYKAKALPVIAKENLAKVTVSISRLEAERAAAQASAAQLLAAGSSLMEVSAALDRINTDLAKQRQAKLHYEKSPDFDAATQYVFEQAQLQAKEPLAAEQAARQAAEEQLGNTQQQLHEAQVFIEHLQRQVADERQQRERAQNDLAQLRADDKAASQRLQQLRRQISVHKATIASDKTGLLAIVTNNYDHLRVTERITPDRVHDPAFQERVAMCLVDEQLLGPVPRNTPPGQFAQQHEDMAVDPDNTSCPDPAGTSRPRPPKPTFEPLPPPSSIMPEEYRVVSEERERDFTKHFAPQLHAMRKDYDLSITRFNADEAWNHKAMGFGADYRQWQSLMCHYATKASDPPQSKEQSHKPHTVKTGLPAKFSGASGQFAEDAIFLFLDYLTGNNIPQPDWPSHFLPLLEGKALQAWLSVAQPLRLSGGTPTWELMRDTLTKAFPCGDRAMQARKLLHTIKQQTRTPEYLRYFRMLVARAGEPTPTDRDLLLWYMRGLKSSIADQCKVNPATGKPWDSFEALAEYSCAIDTYTRDTDTDKPVRANLAHTKGRTLRRSSSQISLRPSHSQVPNKRAASEAGDYGGKHRGSGRGGRHNNGKHGNDHSGGGRGGGQGGGSGRGGGGGRGRGRGGRHDNGGYRNKNGNDASGSDAPKADAK
ncbi:hypothetical protein QJQ45_001224 [Haematococcus lacustris]|nr:hypothetical protein QJQ45_001224 [Haematococcus lacustris]